MFTVYNRGIPTLIDAVWQIGNEGVLKQWMRYCILAGTGSLLLSLCAQLSVPFYPVPITGQTFAVFLIGLTYGWKLGGATIILYLVQGALGFPVFAGGLGGIGWLMCPSSGYLYGFVLAATACGWFAEKGFDKNYFTIALALLAGNVLLYAPGILWLGFFLGFDKPLLQFGLYPFIFGDMVKIILVMILYPTTWKLISKFKKADL